MICSTVREILGNTEKKHGTEDAVRYKISKNEIESKTYTQLREDSESFSRVLSGLGQEGNHIAVIGMTSYAWLAAYFGTVNSGSVIVPLDVNLPAEDVCDLIDRSDSTVLVYDEVRKDVAAIAKERCPQLKIMISMQKKEHDRQAFSFWKLLDEYKGSFGYMPRPDQLCTIMFTSGTTGKSKGVMLTHRNVAENATCLDMKIPERIVIMTVLPIHHAYCLSMDILKGVSLAAVICINDSLMRVAKNIKLFKPEMILMVPLMIETMAKKLEEASFLPAKLVKSQVFGRQFHTICSGGAYLDPSYIDMFEKYDITIQQGYGMTECSPVISISQKWDIRKDSVGQLVPNCVAKTVDGELWVKGSSVMQGYYKMPEETGETLEDGWLKTGDLGYVDEEGFVYLTGRKKNLIITKNGENVSPEELENTLSTNRLVGEILVREKNGVIEAEIYPDQDYVKKKKIKDVKTKMQEVIDEYNRTAAPQKKIYSLIVRDTEFEKTTTRKIKRF